jgi:hypothetical protein
MAQSEVESAQKRWEAADRKVIQIRRTLPARPSAIALIRLKAAEDLQKAARNNWIAMLDRYDEPSDCKWTLAAEHPDGRSPILEYYGTASGARERAAQLVESGYTVEIVHSASGLSAL